MSRFDTDTFVRDEIVPGETLLWQGQPVQGMVLTRLDWYHIPFGVALLYLGISEYRFASGAISESETVAIESFIIAGLFGFMVLFLLVGYRWLDARRRARLTYALTDRRALIAGTREQRQTTSYYLDTLGHIRIRSRSNGVGWIELADVKWKDRLFKDAIHLMQPWFSFLVRNDAQFERIENARDVYEQIIRAKHEHTV